MPGPAHARSGVRDWLSGSPAEALALAHEYQPETRRIVEEGFYKEDRLDIAA
jgi:hypothetical protein